MTDINEIEKINKLARSLKDTGIAANMEDAVRMAEGILIRSKPPTATAQDTSIVQEEVRELEEDNGKEVPIAPIEQPPEPEPVQEPPKVEPEPIQTEEPAVNVPKDQEVVTETAPESIPPKEELITPSEPVQETQTQIETAPKPVQTELSPETLTKEPEELESSPEQTKTVEDSEQSQPVHIESIEEAPAPQESYDVNKEDDRSLNELMAEDAAGIYGNAPNPDAEIIDETPKMESTPTDAPLEEINEDSPAEPNDFEQMKESENTPPHAPPELIDDESATEEFTREIPVEEKKERPTLSEEEKKMSDLSRIFNFGA